MRLKSEATQVAKETAIIGEQQTLIETLEKRVKELEEALTFYAEIPSVGVYIKDSGMKARDTLLNR